MAIFTNIQAVLLFHLRSIKATFEYLLKTRKRPYISQLGVLKTMQAYEINVKKAKMLNSSTKMSSWFENNLIK